MRKSLLNWKTGLLSVLVAAGMAYPTFANAAVKNVMCVKTNTGKYFPVVRVSMMVIPDGGNTFEIVLKDGAGEVNVSEISFEKHEEDIDFSKYQEDNSGSSYIDMSKKIYLMTSTGKYFTFKTLPSLDVQPGTNLINVTIGNEVEKDVTKVFFYRGDNAEEAVGVKPLTTIKEEKLTLMTPISQQMTISGCGDATIAEVYSANGMKVGQAEVSNGVSTIVVGNLTRGVYVVKVGNKALKFMKK